MRMLAALQSKQVRIGGRWIRRSPTSQTQPAKIEVHAAAGDGALAKKQPAVAADNVNVGVLQTREFRLRCNLL